MDKPGYCILIADRNRNIRSFLKRELTAAGHRVHVAETGKHLIQLLYDAIRPDLLVLDPDFPDIELAVLTTKLQDRIPPLPVIVHALDLDMLSGLPLKWRDTAVEKNASSVEVLKIRIPQVLAPTATPQSCPEATDVSGDATHAPQPEPSKFTAIVP